MSAGLWAMRRLIKAHPTRLWTLHELAHRTDLSLADAEFAVDGLVAHGELVRRGSEHYACPVTGEEDPYGS